MGDPVGVREVLDDKSARSAKGFLARLIHKVPFKITKILTDNGKEYIDRFCATSRRRPTSKHVFDPIYLQLKTAHRLTKARMPQTNGMIERFNGRIAGILKTTRFRSSDDLDDGFSCSVTR